MSKEVSHIRKGLQHFLPIIPTLAIVGMRAMITWLSSYNPNAVQAKSGFLGGMTPVQGFFVEVGFWAIVSLITTLCLRLFIDQRVLMTQRVYDESKENSARWQDKLECKCFLVEKIWFAVSLAALVMMAVFDSMARGLPFHVCGYLLGIPFYGVFIWLLLSLFASWVGIFRIKTGN